MMVGIYDEEMEKKVLCEEAEERGEARGIQMGRIEGLQAGRVTGIISTLLDLGYSREEIASVLRKKLQVTQTQAEKYLERYDSDSL